VAPLAQLTEFADDAPPPLTSDHDKPCAGTGCANRALRKCPYALCAPCCRVGVGKEHHPVCEFHMRR